MKRILIIAGESSGDLHASWLIRSTLNSNPDLKFFGIGGTKMHDAGCNILIDNQELAVVGIVEVLRHLPVILKTYFHIKKILKQRPPDLLILVDYPDFNLRIAKIAKRYHVKTLYFISPQLWAWRKNRIKTIKRCINKIAVIFPFEVDFYRNHDVDAVYVGNPLLKEVKPTLGKAIAYTEFGLDPHKPVIGLLPGSRRSEIRYNFATILATAKLLKKRYPQVQFILPLANTLSLIDVQQQIQASELNINIVSGNIYNILQLCNAAICVSGTVTLEVALMGIPFAIIYRLSALSYFIGKLLIDLNYIGLCNIIAGKKIVQEFIQNNATPEKICAEIIDLLENSHRKQQMQQDFMLLREKLISDDIVDISTVVNTLLPRN